VKVDDDRLDRALRQLLEHASPHVRAVAAAALVRRGQKSGQVAALLEASKPEGWVLSWMQSGD
jgi:hypothetical protein